MTTLTVSKKDKVAWIEFSSPAHNSLTGKGMRNLVNALTEVGQDKETGVTILKSGGERTFCAGADFKELLAVKTEAESIAFFSGFAELFQAILSCPKIVITQVQGKAVGGALGIIAASDLCYAAERAEAKLSELNVGIGPFIVGPIIQAKIGLANLNKLTYDPNRFFKAEWLLSNGFYTELTDSFESLEQRVHEKAEELNGYNPAALAQIKSALRTDMDQLKALLMKRVKLSAGLLLTDFTQKRLSEL